MIARAVAHRAGLLCLLMVLLVGPWLAAPALAHSALIATEPGDGAVLTDAPSRFTLRFNESVRPIVGRLSLPDGRTVLLNNPPSGTEIVFDLPALTDKGSYLLSWRVTSSDGHPVAGGNVFSVGHQTETADGSIAAPLVTRATLWGARVILVAGFLFGISGVAFAHLAGRPAPVATRHAVTLGFISLPVVGVFQALDVLGQGPTALSGIAPWYELLRGPPALALLLAALALLLARMAERRALLAGLALILMAGAAATTGHAATAPPQALMRPAVALHMLGAGLWIGALLPLIAALRAGNAQPALRRFGAIIPWALAVLLASGAALSVVQVHQVAALWTTAYGRVLLVKLVLVAGLLALGLWNRIALTPRAEAGDNDPLRRVIRVEILLALLVIAVLGLWRFTAPPRTLAPLPVAIVQQIGDARLSARIHLGSNRPGPIAVALSDFRVEGRPFTPLETRIEFSKPAFGLGPFARTLSGGQADLDAGSFILPMDGFWVLRVTFLIDEFRAEQILDLITLEPAR